MFEKGKYHKGTKRIRFGTIWYRVQVHVPGPGICPDCLFTMHQERQRERATEFQGSYWVWIMIWVLMTKWVCHLYCNFESGYTRRTTVIFGTRNDGRLQINSLASNNDIVSATKWHQRFIKNGFKNPVILSKSSKFSVVLTIQFFFKFYHHMVQIIMNVWRDLRFSISALAKATRKNSSGKFTAKIDQVFHVTITIADADIGNLKSRHICLDHMLVKFKQNLIVRTTPCQILTFLTKNSQPFSTKRRGPFWKTFL